METSRKAALFFKAGSSVFRFTTCCYSYSFDVCTELGRKRYIEEYPSPEHMFNPFKNMRLSAKVALLGAGSVFITAAALVLLSVWQSGQYNALAQGEVDALIDADLDHITQGVYNLVRTENEAVQLQVDNNLKVARHLLTGAGGVQPGTRVDHLDGDQSVDQGRHQNRLAEASYRGTVDWHESGFVRRDADCR